MMTIFITAALLSGSGGAEPNVNIHSGLFNSPLMWVGLALVGFFVFSGLWAGLLSSAGGGGGGGGGGTSLQSKNESRSGDITTSYGAVTGPSINLNSGGLNSPLVWIGIAAAALLIFTLLKRKR